MPRRQNRVLCSSASRIASGRSESSAFLYDRNSILLNDGEVRALRHQHGIASACLEERLAYAVSRERARAAKIVAHQRRHHIKVRRPMGDKYIATGNTNVSRAAPPTSARTWSQQLLIGTCCESRPGLSIARVKLREASNQGDEWTVACQSDVIRNKDHRFDEALRYQYPVEWIPVQWRKVGNSGRMLARDWQ
jgi:hypothetical protein